jgi:KipI family sensor histidine kinase inhibitor
MSARLTPIRIADDVFEFEVATPAQAQALAGRLRTEIEADDVVAGLDRVAIRFSPTDAMRVAERLRHIRNIPVPEPDTRPPVEIAVRYGGVDGPDLEWICEDAGLTKEDLIRVHTEREHVVEMIGFTPGFSYISGLPDGLSIPRLDNPRPRVPAGSVGLTAGFTGIYALPGPGGWPLIGRTDAALFDADRDVPFLLSPGQRVTFRAV